MRGIFLLDKLEGRNKWIHFCKERFEEGKRQVKVKVRVNEGLFGGWPQSLQKSRSQSHLLLGRIEHIGTQKCYQFPRASATNYVLQTRQLKVTCIYSLTVLEARSLKSECCQGCISSAGSRGESILASSSFWQLLAFLTYCCIIPIPASAFPRPPSVCVLNLPLSHLSLDFRPTQIIQDNLISRPLI